MSADIYTFDHAGTRVRFAFPDPDDHIARQIRHGRGFYETAMLEHIRARLQPGCVVLDIGAHLGNHSVFFGKCCDPSRVFSFEPHPQTFAALKENIRINDLCGTVIPHQLALGAADAAGVMQDVSVRNSGMSRVAIADTGAVNVRALDGLLGDTLQRCDCIKLDVEGMEAAVLRGATGIIKRFKPLIYAECAHESKYREVLGVLAALGYASIQAFNATATYCFKYSEHPPAVGDAKFPYRLAFFAGDEGNFQFAREIIDYFRALGAEVHVVETAVVDADRLCAEMNWCDLAWFEWANGPVIQASRLPKRCHMVCRLHKYEIFTGAASAVNWSKVDDLILVSPRFVEEFRKYIDRDIRDKTRVHVIPNALNMDSFKPGDIQSKQKGFEIAFIARFHADKNPALMLYIMRELVKRDRRYRCHVAGNVQDPVQFQYFQHMVQTLHLRDNIVYDGHIRDIRTWLDDKHYLLSTSVVESHGVGIMEAMAMGLKPVIHNHIGDPSCHFDPACIFDTIDQAVAMILADDYAPAAYRRFIQSRYSARRIQPRYRRLVTRRIGHRRAVVPRQPRISILIPTYNRAAFLGEAVSSALDQDYPNFEVIVVDDGSTDNTAQVLTEIGDDPRLRIINKPHGGAPDTRNRAITTAGGDYVLWLDSDDVLLPDVLADYAWALHRFPGADVVYPDLEIFDPHGNSRALNYPDYYFQGCSPAEIVRGNLVPNGGSLVRRDLYVAAGLFDTSFTRAHDYEFWSRVIDKARFKHLGRTSYRWRWHGDNMSAENQTVDRSYEGRIVCALVERFGLERLFPDLDWGEARTADARGSLRIADILLRWGCVSAADGFVDRAAGLNPDNPRIPVVRQRVLSRAYNARGEAAYAMGDFESALELFENSVQCDADFVDARVNLGTVHWANQDHGKCLTCLTAALKLAPYHGTAVINTATVLAHLGKPAEGLALCRGYLQRDPFAADVRRLAGELTDPAPDSNAQSRLVNLTAATGIRHAV